MNYDSSIAAELTNQILLINSLSSNVKMVGLKFKRARPLHRRKKLLPEEKTEIDLFIESNSNLFKSYNLQLSEAKKELI